MGEAKHLTTALHLALASLAALAAAAPAPPPERPMKQLSRIIMMTHALNWLELVPGDPRRQTATWEQWPGR